VDDAFEDQVKKSGVELRAKRSDLGEKSRSISPQHALQKGSIVRIPKWKTTGEVLSVDPNGQIRVAMGNLQMTLKPSEYEAVPGASKRPKLDSVTIRWESHSSGEHGESSPSLDLRGQRLDEALARAERYLEKVFTSRRYTQVTLVHGLGTGALREGVRKLLGELSFVSDYRDGGPGQGGSGATIVELRT
jgi:DNA mismatch repair protein MutS2